MATRTICDGCGTEDGEFTVLGVAIKREYCEACVTIVRLYLTERDKLHTRVAGKWQDGVAALKARIKDAHPGLALPDDGA